MWEARGFVIRWWQSALPEEAQPYIALNGKGQPVIILQAVLQHGNQ